jgi:transposase
MNEREQCEKHIDFLTGELPGIAAKSIITIDRGYPSADMFEKFQQSKLSFVGRCKSGFSKAADDAPLGDSIITLKNGIDLRIVKFELKNGSVETLATNLFDLPMEDIIEIYSLRWGIETMYFKLKQELCVEKFSGKTANSIRQDFWAGMLLLNSVAVFQHEANNAVRARQKDKNPKHLNLARTSDLIITLRDRFIFAALCGHPLLTAWEMDDVIRTLARVVSPVRPERSYPRNFKPFYKVNHNLKSHL